MPNYSRDLDGLFLALGNPTRRAVVERLRLGSATVSELAGEHTMAMPSFMQHLDVLEAAGIVQSVKQGRVRRVSLNPDGLGTAEHWLDRQRNQWSERLDRLDLHLLHLHKTMTNRFSDQPNPELDLVLERVIDVPRELVWKAWTTPELMKQWFTPRPWMTPVVEVDLRPGGFFHVEMRGPDGEGGGVDGCFLEVAPNERLVWTTALKGGYRPQRNSSEPGDFLFTATISLEDTPEGGTKYTALVVHPDPETRKTHEEMGFYNGWSTVVDQLAELMKGS